MAGIPSDLLATFLGTAVQGFIALPALPGVSWVLDSYAAKVVTSQGGGAGGWAGFNLDIYAGGVFVEHLDFLIVNQNTLGSVDTSTGDPNFTAAPDSELKVQFSQGIALITQTLRIKAHLI